MSDELKPCPFCGHDDPQPQFEHGEHYVVCQVCFASTRRSPTHTTMVQDWNIRTRAPDPRLAELEEIAERMKDDLINEWAGCSEPSSVTAYDNWKQGKDREDEA